MAHTTINVQPYFIQGDGVSTTAVINLGITPISVSLADALQTKNGLSVSSNISSVVFAGSIITVTFVAAFSYALTLLLNITPVTLAAQSTVFTSVAPANPAAGAACSVVVPTGYQWTIRSAQFLLATSALVAVRQIIITTSDANSRVMGYAYSTTTQIASLAYEYTFASSLIAGFLAAGFVSIVNQPMPNLVLGPGATFTISVAGIQTTDQLSNITLMVEQTVI